MHLVLDLVLDLFVASTKGPRWLRWTGYLCVAWTMGAIALYVF